MTVLVTGATGFVGRRLVVALQRRGHSARALVRNGRQHDGLDHDSGLDVRRYDGTIDSVNRAFDGNPVSVVAHLATYFAAEHEADDIDRLCDSNVRLGMQLFESMDRVGCRSLVLAGTNWQYFQTGSYRPVNLYAATKQALESILDYYVDARSFRSEILYLYDTYAADDHRRKLVRLLFEAAHSGKPLAMSAGEQAFDIVHADDACRAFVDAIERVSEPERAAATGRYSLYSSRSATLRAFVGTVEQAIGQRIPIEWGVRPYREREVMRFSEFAPRPPGWTAETDPVAGLSSAWQAFLQSRAPR